MKPTPNFTILDRLPRGVKKDPHKHLRCTHAHASLRGCWLPAGHSGLHDNPNRGPQETFKAWGDSDGAYINSASDWSAHIDQLGGRK